ALPPHPPAATPAATPRNLHTPPAMVQASLRALPSARRNVSPVAPVSISGTSHRSPFGASSARGNSPPPIPPATAHALAAPTPNQNLARLPGMPFYRFLQTLSCPSAPLPR